MLHHLLEGPKDPLAPRTLCEQRRIPPDVALWGVRCPILILLFIASISSLVQVVSLASFPYGSIPLNFHPPGFIQDLLATCLDVVRNAVIVTGADVAANGPQLASKADRAEHAFVAKSSRTFIFLGSCKKY